VGPTKRGKGTKLPAIEGRHGFPVAVCRETAGRPEVEFVAATMEKRFVVDVPERAVGVIVFRICGMASKDLRGFDCFPLDRVSLRAQGNRVKAMQRGLVAPAPGVGAKAARGRLCLSFHSATQPGPVRCCSDFVFWLCPCTADFALSLLFANSLGLRRPLDCE
jgi:hypothetical protein